MLLPPLPYLLPDIISPLSGLSDTAANPQHSFQVNLMPCIIIVWLTFTFPSSSLISHYSIIFYTYLLSTVPLSTCLSVSHIYFAVLPSILTTVLTLSTKYDLFVTLSSSFLSCCHDISDIFFLTWQISDSPFASRAVSVPGPMHNDTYYTIFFQIPLQNLFPFKTETDIIKPE